MVRLKGMLRLPVYAQHINHDAVCGARDIKMIRILIRQAGLLGMFILGFLSLGFAQQAQTQTAQAEGIVVTTYYPSPYGSYNELRLSPHSQPITECGEPNTQGAIYVNMEGQPLVCNGVSWVSLGGGDYWVLNGNNLYPMNPGWMVGKGTDAPAFKVEVNGKVNARQGFCIGYDGTDAAKCKSDWPVIDCRSQGKCIAGFNMRVASSSLDYQKCVDCLAVTPPVEPPYPWPPPADPQPPQYVGHWRLFCTIQGPGQVTNCSGSYGSYFVIAGPRICASANSGPMTFGGSWVGGANQNAGCTQDQIDKYVCRDCNLSMTQGTTICGGSFSGGGPNTIPMQSGYILKCIKD